MGTMNSFKFAAQVAAVTGLLSLPVDLVGAATAAAQSASISAEFRTALEPYGSFRHAARWGDVWVPERVSRDWKPYTFGHWVYSDDYGWYWDSDRDEAPWGWVAFHYGRWVFDNDIGWAWVPGSEWGPAWVEWRRGSGRLGWAPLPPDDIIVDVRDDPQYWVFVRPHDFLATRIATVLVEPERAFLDDTTVVNETVVVHERNFAVNPGIAPAFLAAEIGRPIPAFQVQPRILAGTANIQGAIEVRAQDLKRADVRSSIIQGSNVRLTNNTIRPTSRVPPPQPLGPNERGRLGQNPPRAAIGVAQQAPQRPGALQTQEGANRPGTVGRAPERGPEQGLRERGPQPGTVGRAPERGPEQGLRERGPQPGTVGRAPERGPEQGLRERGPQPGTVGRAPERGQGQGR